MVTSPCLILRYWYLNYFMLQMLIKYCGEGKYYFNKYFHLIQQNICILKLLKYQYKYDKREKKIAFDTVWTHALIEHMKAEVKKCTFFLVLKSILQKEGNVLGLFYLQFILVYWLLFQNWLIKLSLISWIHVDHVIGLQTAALAFGLRVHADTAAFSPITKPVCIQLNNNIII